MGFGAQAFGSIAAGSGGARSVLSAIALTRTTVRVDLSRAVPARNRAMVTDALYDRGWTLRAPSSPTAHVPRVVWVERVPGEFAVVLQLDALLDGPGVTYEVEGSSAAFGSEVASRRATFDTFGETRLLRTQAARSFDLANAQAEGEVTDDSLGTLKRDADGDFANDAGVENLKKRVIRRLTTQRGAFRHLPDYGLLIAQKGRTTSGLLRDLQAQALRQVRLELGVTDVRVDVSAPAPGVALLEVAVEAKGVRFGVDVKIPTDGG